MSRAFLGFALGMQTFAFMVGLVFHSLFLTLWAGAFGLYAAWQLSKD
jgi:hypothetical protein